MCVSVSVSVSVCAPAHVRVYAYSECVNVFACAKRAKEANHSVVLYCVVLCCVEHDWLSRAGLA